jgi:hypothetical protein
VRAATASSTCSIPRHSAANRNSVVRSGPPSIVAKMVRSLYALQHLAALVDPDDGAFGGVWCLQFAQAQAQALPLPGLGVGQRHRPGW